MDFSKDDARVPIICTWVVIVIATVLFWPLGAVLAWKRGNYSRKTCLNLGKISMVFGVIMMIGAILLGYFMGDDYIGACAVYGICGVVFARMGYEGVKKARVYEKIIFEVEEEGVLMIPMLADEIGMPEVDVLKNLQIMFKKNLLPYHELAHNNKRLLKK